MNDPVLDKLNTLTEEQFEQFKQWFEQRGNCSMHELKEFLDTL